MPIQDRKTQDLTGFKCFRTSKVIEYERAEKTNIGIAHLLGEYLANCIDFKYNILKYFADVSRLLDYD